MLGQPRVGVLVQQVLVDGLSSSPRHGRFLLYDLQERVEAAGPRPASVLDPLALAPVLGDRVPLLCFSIVPLIDSWSNPKCLTVSM